MSSGWTLLQSAARLRVAYAELVGTAEDLGASVVSIGFLHLMAFRQEPGGRASFIAKLSEADRVSISSYRRDAMMSNRRPASMKMSPYPRK